ncbi:MAG: hypothetical protein HDT28_04830 [Clostridiales bacterium]|nr:hypothetical protein [Clostridiales bacterium]
METITFDLPTIAGVLKRLCAFFLFLWGILIVAIFVDLWDGVKTARILKEPIRSHKLRITIDKITEYWRPMLIAALVDLIGSVFTFYIVPFASIFLCLGLLTVEGKSLYEHAKRRKSKVAELKDIMQGVIRAANDKDALAAIEAIRDFIETSKKK